MCCTTGFQPTLPARGATVCPAPRPPARSRISTHAPRTGSDLQPRVGSHFMIWTFQPTLPARGATRDPQSAVRPVRISTHAPRTGSDISGSWSAAGGSDFNPRSPHGERPKKSSNYIIKQMISTHAPRTGSDGIVMPQGRMRDDFNPRSPHGERRDRDWLANFARQFQPTLPARGATSKRSSSPRRRRKFQPTLPARGATLPGVYPPGMTRFQPTLPARGATVI